MTDDKEITCVSCEMILECFENCAGDIDYGIFMARRLLEQFPDCNNTRTQSGSVAGLVSLLESMLFWIAQGDYSAMPVPAIEDMLKVTAKSRKAIAAYRKENGHE